MSRKAQQLGLKEVKIDLGVFDYPIYAVIGKFDVAKKYISQKLEDPKLLEYEEARGLTFIRHGYVPVIWIPRRPSTPREFSTLAHEAVHAALAVFSWAGLRVMDDTDEVLGHTVGHIVNSILESFKKPAKKS